MDRNSYAKEAKHDGAALYGDESITIKVLAPANRDTQYIRCALPRALVVIGNIKVYKVLLSEVFLTHNVLEL